MIVDDGTGDRWEAGSDFGLSSETGDTVLPWDAQPFSLWGSGRDALRGLLDWGREHHGWRSILVPTYFCQDVVSSTLRAAPVRTYSWSPLSGPTVVPAREGDVVLIPAVFGARPNVRAEGGVMTIEDHSHDLLAPWATASRADYAIASLRKTLPLPDGGVVWSPSDLSVPPEVPITEQHASSALLRLSAMILKRDYLAGERVMKKAYRQMSVTGERMMASGHPSGISSYSRARLATLPVREWRSRRARNMDLLRVRLGALDLFEVLDFPYMLILLFAEAQARDRVRDRLIDLAVYPGVLWPLEDPVVDGIADEHVVLSRRVLALPCDQRYDADDMERVAAAVERAVADVSGRETAGPRAGGPGS